MLRKLCLILALLMVLLLAAGVGLAQDALVVTDDEVNAIAAKLYCPVCENIPLDACGTAACDDWRYEIRLQLQQGLTEQAIIDDFVRRFGDRVVGTPQDPTLRFISLVVPYAGGALALGIAIYTFVQWRRKSPAPLPPAAAAGDKYQELIEQDLAG